MRTIKVLLTALLAALAVAAGLVVTMLAALASVVILAVKRWRHRGESRPQPSQPQPEYPTAHFGKSRNGNDEVIDVVATEVPVDPSNR